MRTLCLDSFNVSKRLRKRLSKYWILKASFIARALVWITYLSLFDLRFNIYASFGRYEEWARRPVLQSFSFTASV